MKNYIKIGLIALILAPTNLAWGIGPEHIEIKEQPLFKTEENKQKVAEMIQKNHAEWVKRENELKELKTKEDVKAPGSDIEWGKHIFSGDKKLESLGKKLSGTAKRVTDWISDLWNGNRGKVENRFKEYSKSDVPGKKLFLHDEELIAQKAFQKLRPDIQLEYINKFVKTENETFVKNENDLRKNIDDLKKQNEKLMQESLKNSQKFKELFKKIYPEKNLDDLIKQNTLKDFISELKTLKHVPTSDQKELLKLFDNGVTMKNTIDKTENEIKSLRTTSYQKLHEDYLKRLTEFRKEIDQVLKGNKQNVHLKYNLQTKSFEFHTGPSSEDLNAENTARELAAKLAKEKQEAEQKKAREQLLKQMEEQSNKRIDQAEKDLEQKAKDELNELAQEFQKGLISRQEAERKAKEAIEKAKKEEESIFGSVDNSPIPIGTADLSAKQKNLFTKFDDTYTDIFLEKLNQADSKAASAKAEKTELDRTREELQDKIKGINQSDLLPEDKKDLAQISLRINEAQSISDLKTAEDDLNRWIQFNP